MISRTHRLLTKRAAVWLCGLFVLTGVQIEAQTSVAPTAGSSSQLVGQLTKQLSITRPQARGGAGALFALAKSRLSADEFGKVSAAVPGMKGLLKAAPAPAEHSELSTLESSLPGNIGRTAEVAEAFHQLGLSPEMGQVPAGDDQVCGIQGRPEHRIFVGKSAEVDLIQTNFKHDPINDCPAKFSCTRPSLDMPCGSEQHVA
jgi:hypothetical protein